MQYKKEMDDVKELAAFIDIAQSNRKYPKATAAAYRSSLNLFEKELNDEERKSIDKIRMNLDNIYREVVYRNKSNVSLSSLSTYKRRFNSLINDFSQYGRDPSQMDKWTRKTRRVKGGSNVANESLHVSPEAKSAHTIEIALIRGGTAKVVVPLTASRQEIYLLKAVLDATVADQEGADD